MVSFFDQSIQDHIRSVQRSAQAEKERELWEKAEQGDEAAMAKGKDLK